MAGLIFHDYVVDEIIYKNNAKFNLDTDEVELIPKFASKITIKNDMAVVSLKSYIKAHDDLPYSFSVRIIGFFHYNVEEADNIDFEKYLKINSIAILFPYIRSLVSDITGKSNIYPNYIIQVFNIAEMLSENDLIEIIRE